MTRLLNRCLDCGDPATGSRCPDCDQARRAARDAARPSTARRGYGARHQRLGGRAIRRAKVCAACGRPSRRDDPLTRGHRVPVSLGGTPDDGYVALHRSCNSRQGNR